VGLWGGDAGTGQAFEEVWFCHWFGLAGGGDGLGLGGEFPGIVFSQFKVEGVREIESGNVCCAQNKKRPGSAQLLRRFAG
jgi:hypothetical protein